MGRYVCINIRVLGISPRNIIARLFFNYVNSYVDVINNF